MRGKGLELLQRRVGDGITPAYAGKSQKDKQHHLFYEDHPRICGEKLELPLEPAVL